MKYLITYDLKTPGRDYASLTAAIRSLGRWARISGSCWAVQTPRTASQIRDALALCMDANDILFVCPFDDWASLGLNHHIIYWLNH